MTAEAFERQRAVLEVFDRGRTEYYAGRFPEAQSIFESISAEDPPSSCYAERCRQLIANPPKEGWAGVWVMTEK
jgi:adenylate cyclase